MIPERHLLILLITVLVGLPAGAAAVWLLTRFRVRAGWPRRRALRASVSEVAMIVGTVPWLWMILTPTTGDGGVQLIPLRDLIDVLRGDDAVVQVVGNLLAFAAIGFFAPIRFTLISARWAPLVVAGIVAGLSVVVEVLQFVFQLGRVSSIDDVLVNTIGAVLASLLSARWWRSREPRGSISEPVV